MTDFRRSPDGLVFSSAVQAVQEARGSRRAYRDAAWLTFINSDLAGFLSLQKSFFMATASADGQPYIQHRGGPAGFIKVLDERTLGFADYRGNRQYVSTGNLAENDRVQLFFIDYANQRRIKLWGRARVVVDDAELIERLFPEGYRARAEQAVIVAVEAWDVNCPQHIPQRFDAEDVARALASRDARIQELEAEIATLKHGTAAGGSQNGAQS
jgi:hypothetical protein